MDFVIPDVQWIVVRLNSASGMTLEDIAMYTDVDQSSVKQILAYFKKNGDVYHPVYQPLHCYSVANRFQSPDPYLEELRLDLEALSGEPVPLSAIWKSLVQGGCSMKKLSHMAMERHAVERAEFLARMRTYQAQQLIFVDESAIDRPVTYRGQTWLIRGGKTTRKTFCFEGRRFSVLPALALEGAIHVGFVEGDYDSDRFHTFIDQLLDFMEPFPNQNSVIVMDKSRIHQHPDILDLIESRGMKYEFLPPSSPYDNPLELALYSVKNLLRQNGDLARLATAKLSYADIDCTLLSAFNDLANESRDLL